MALFDGWKLRKANPDTERVHLNKILTEISAAIAAAGTVDSVVSGTGISVNSADPINPIVNLSAGSIASLALADSSTQPGDNISTLVNDAGYTTNTGTVTSVNLAASTGLTPSGGPIVGAGSLTYTLSANLQAWHGLATSAKQDADTQLTSLAGLSYAGNTLKVIRVNAAENDFELAAASSGSGDVVGPASSVNNRVVFFDGVTGKLIKDSGLTLSGSNTGDQTSIVGITGTLAEFNTALTGADFATGGGTATGTNTGDQTSIVGITGSLAEFNTALTGADFASGGGTATGTNTGDQTITLTGDVTGSGTGSFAATIANDAVTYAKMQNISATDRLLGRSTAGAGDTEEIVCTAAGRALLDDVDAAAQRTTLGLGTMATAAAADYLPLTAGVGSPLSADLYFSDSNFLIRADTADGADTKQVNIAAGGSTSTARGAFISLYGNEHATNPGEIGLFAGSISNIISHTGNVQPQASNTYTLGTASLLYSAMYVTTQAPLTNNNTVASTAYVDLAVAAGGGSGLSHPQVMARITFGF